MPGLEGALSSDAKLRELFDKLDLDHGGTLSAYELKVAIEATGRTMSVEKMLSAADGECVPLSDAGPESNAHAHVSMRIRTERVRAARARARVHALSKYLRITPPTYAVRCHSASSQETRSRT